MWCGVVCSAVWCGVRACVYMCVWVWCGPVWILARSSAECSPVRVCGCEPSNAMGTHAMGPRAAWCSKVRCVHTHDGHVCWCMWAQVKKLIKSLQAARGSGTSMISLIIPPRSRVARAVVFTFMKGGVVWCGVRCVVWCGVRCVVPINARVG